MTLREFIDRNFNGNLAAFAKANDIPYRTAWDLLNRAVIPQRALREKLKRKGIRF